MGPNLIEMILFFFFFTLNPKVFGYIFFCFHFLCVCSFVCVTSQSTNPQHLRFTHLSCYQTSSHVDFLHRNAEQSEGPAVSLSSIAIHIVYLLHEADGPSYPSCLALCGGWDMSCRLFALMYRNTSFFVFCILFYLKKKKQEKIRPVFFMRVNNDLLEICQRIIRFVDFKFDFNGFCLFLKS